MPDCNKIQFGEIVDIEKITTSTAAVVIEVVQGEAGIRYADKDYWHQLRHRCNETETLLVLDEIQTGFGRTGTLFAFEQIGIVPDILTLAKGMGGGMPIGAFIASQEIMNCLTHNPVLGHITTFGGHPVSCAAALASLEVIEREKLYLQVPQKAKLFRDLLANLPKIKELRQQGMMMALEFENQKYTFDVINRCLAKGLLTDWFLFCDTALRIAPPLVITEEEIIRSCEIMIEVIKP
jgi:acetylornithine/succinyldiaminopimelate/putrescine aminotransferase